MNFLKKILRTNHMTSAMLEVYFFSQKFLKAKGWQYSRFIHQPLDQERKPLPWFTYASIHFIAQKLNTTQRVFEFGSGNSTKWFSEHVKNVISVEHDTDFYEIIHKELSALTNVDHVFGALGSAYSSKILEYESTFDIVVIDGRERIECAKNCLKALKVDGIVIWDNSDREKYKEGYDFLRESGFKQLDFRGAGPISHSEWQTSIFYRKNNCFDI